MLNTTMNKTISLKNWMTLTAVLAAALPLQAEDLPDVTDGRVDRDASSLTVTADYFLSVSEAPIPASSAGIAITGGEDPEGDLFGATIAYGLGAHWAIEGSFSSGSSSTDWTENVQDTVITAVDWESDEDWYELRVRWMPPFVSFGNVQGYLSAGITLLEAQSSQFASTEVKVDLVGVPAGTYSGEAVKSDQETLFANIGFGLAYVQSTADLAYGVKLEANALFGRIDRESDAFAYIPLIPSDSSTSSEADLTGFLGRGAAFVIVPVESIGANISLEAGARIYSWRANSNNSTIWGPFAKIGAQWRF